MNFQNLIRIIPVFHQITIHCTSRTIHPDEICHAMVLVRRGHVMITAKDGPPVVCAQAYACHPQHGPFNVEVPKTKESEYTVLTYRICPDNSPWTLSGPLHTLSEVKIHYMLDEMLRTVEQADEHRTEEEQAARQFRLRLMLERILYIYLHESGLAQVKRTSNQSIEETLAYINEHYMLKLTLPMLARRAGMSDGHYTVLFKKATGTSFIPYLQQLRVEKAKQMFMQTELSAKEIAQKVGFNDYFHFSKTFKKLEGASPSSYLSKVSSKF